MTTVQTSHRAGAAWWLALFAMGAVFLGARAGTGSTPALLEPLPEWDGAAGPAGAQASGAPTRAPLAPPAHLVIPAIGVRATVRPVGLDAQRALVTPPAT